MSIKKVVGNGDKDKMRFDLLLQRNNRNIDLMYPSISGRGGNVKTIYGGSSRERLELCRHMNNRLIGEGITSSLVDCSRAKGNLYELITNTILQTCAGMNTINDEPFPLKDIASNSKDSDIKLWFLLKEIQWKYGCQKFALFFHNADQLANDRSVVNQLNTICATEVPWEVRDEYNKHHEDQSHPLTKNAEFILYDEIKVGCLFNCANERLYRIADLSMYFPTILSKLYKVKSLSDDIADTINQ